MTLTEAFKFTRTDTGNPVTSQWLRDWKQAEAVIVAAGYCPHCACDGRKEKLGPQLPGNRDTYAGRECPVCEQFFKCGEQPEYATEADESAHSDADPGL